MDDYDDGYELDDPKSPGYADRMWAYADMLRKREREDALADTLTAGGSASGIPWLVTDEDAA